MKLLSNSYNFERLVRIAERPGRDPRHRCRSRPVPCWATLLRFFRRSSLRNVAPIESHDISAADTYLDTPRRAEPFCFAEQASTDKCAASKQTCTKLAKLNVFGIISVKQKLHLLSVVILGLAAFNVDLLASEENPPIISDQALFERRAQLMHMLSNIEQTRIAQFESRIAEGQRLIRSAEAYMQTQPTPLNPNRDIAADRRTGQEMRAQGEALIKEGQAAILVILRHLQQRIESGAKAAEKAVAFTLDLPVVAMANNLPLPLAKIMEITRDAGFARIFFDRAFCWQGDNFVVNSELGHALYQLLLADDNDRLILGRAFEPFLQMDDEDAGASRPELIFDGRDSLRPAMIAAECYQLADGNRYLSFRTLDLESWQQIAAVIVRLPTNDENQNNAIKTVQLVDAEGMTRRFSELHDPYLFGVMSDFRSDGWTLGFFKMRLLQTLLSSQMPLRFGESVFMRSYYMPKDKKLDWMDAENALFIMRNLSDGSNAVEARPRASDQSVTIGNLLFSPAQ